SRRRHTSFSRDWSSDVCSSDLFAGECDFVGAERRAVRGGLALLVGRAVADNGAAGDQGRAVRLAGGLDGGGDGIRIMAVNPGRVPAGSLEALQCIARFREGEGAVDGDFIVIIEDDEL